MRTQLFVLTAAFCAAALTANAQREQTVLGDRGLRFTGIWAGWNHQITGFGDDNSYMSGWQFDAEFGKSLYLGYGNFYLREDARWDQVQNQKFGLRFSAFKVGYAVKGFKAVHPLINLDFGPGRLKSEGFDDDRVFIVQPGAGLEINLFRWMRLALTGGYRFVTDTNQAGLNDQDLSGYFGQASLKFGVSWGDPAKRRD